MAHRNIIVVGASLGGVEALQSLVGQLPHNLPATIFVVQHISPDGPQFLHEILTRAGTLPVKIAEQNEAFKPGQIYVARADHHLLISDGHIQLSRGPRENRYRPAIDSLFRSAAAFHDSKVIGVILTGLLDDGTAGLDAVKRSGGVAVVQDPKDAVYPDMPLSAIDNVKVDYIVPLSGMGAVLKDLVTNSRAPGNPGTSDIPRDVIMEAKIAGEALSDIGIVEDLGIRSPYGCPDCGGVLWEMKQGKPLRFRCNTGHAFTYRSLLTEQSTHLERAIWAAIRALEERANMLGRMARQEKEGGRYRSSKDFDREMNISKGHAQALRELLLKGETPPPDEVRKKEIGDEQSAA